jgi:Family of unknown function (DUF5681)
MRHAARLTESAMSEQERSGGAAEYRVGPGRPPLHTRFKKGQSGNPRGSRAKPLPQLLIAALNERVETEVDGRRRWVTRHQAIIANIVEKAAADLRAAKLLFELMRRVEPLTAEPEQPLSDAAKRQVIANLTALFLHEEPPPEG